MRSFVEGRRKLVAVVVACANLMLYGHGRALAVEVTAQRSEHGVVVRNPEQAKIAERSREFAAMPPAVKTMPLVTMPLVFEDSFEKGMSHWVTTDVGQPTPVWHIQSTVDGRVNSYLRVTGKSSYKPPYRSPHSIALLKDIVVRSFELTTKVQNTNVEAGPHRDLCFFWGYQDPAHFYYAHLGAKPDPYSSQIFVVNGADRKMITTTESAGIPWTEGWHQVKVVHNSEDGLMQVFFDDMQSPVFSARDTTFRSGRIGLGTFDDNGNFDEVKLSGELLQSNPPQ